MKTQINHARHHAGLMLALAGLLSAVTLTVVPTESASAQTAPNWSYTGSLNIARSLHTETLLQNGQVLVAGGNDPGPGDSVIVVPINSAELYNPATGTWINTGSLNAGHAYHTATLLQNGKVLVAGGVECPSYFDPCFISKSAELYDPATGTWSVTGNLNTARYAFTATLLPNGKVLAVGDAFGRHDAELYDPATETWSYTGALNTATSRFGHTATLLPNGKVLIAGGGYCGNGCFRLSSSELYDPATGTWSITGDLITSRSRHTATLLPSGKVLAAAGGYYNNGYFNGLNAAELFDPTTGTWSSTGDLTEFRGPHSATLLPSGKVLVAGGSCELYDPTTEKWTNTASLNIGRYEPIATLLLNGKVLVTGDFLDTAELYDSGANPIDDAQFFVRQQYLNFLNREPDQGGWDYWTSQITSCPPNDQGCINERRVAVADAFFFEPEFQQTASYVFRIYRLAFGDNQPFPNPDADSRVPGFNLKIPKYSKFIADRAQVVGGSNLAQKQLDFANAFVQRSEFLAKYPAGLSPTDFINAVLATITGANPSVNLSSQQSTLLDLYNQGGRGAVVYRLADDNLQTNPINNRTFIDAEYNLTFVANEYFGYLGRDGDTFGMNFWLTQINSAPLRDVSKQHAMVCSFITSTEYQQRFGSTVTRSNADCVQ